MAIPTQPSLATIATDALKLAGYPDGGSATQQTVAQQWVEEAKMDIQNMADKYDVQLKSLFATAYGVTTDAVSRYANPDDCSNVYSVSLLKGDHEGTATAVTQTAITLAADEDISAGDAEGRIILLTSGTGVGNASQISDYNATTKVATVTPRMATDTGSYDGTENYMIVDNHQILTKHNSRVLDETINPWFSDEPVEWFPQGQGNADDDETGEFELYPTPDDTYGLKIRYYINITLVDLASNLMKTLYRKWYPLLIRKVLYRQLKLDRDAERGAAEESTFFQLVEDYVLNDKSIERKEVSKAQYF